MVDRGQRPAAAAAGAGAGVDDGEASHHAWTSITSTPTLASTCLPPVAAVDPHPPAATPAPSPPPPPPASFRTLVNRDGSLPRQDWSRSPTTTTMASTTTISRARPRSTSTFNPDPNRLLEVTGLDRGRLTFEGVFLNAMCSLRRLGLRNISSSTVVVRLGSTVGDQLRWQLRNDNLDSLLAEHQNIPTNTVAALARLTDLPESNAMFDSVGLISEITLQPGEIRSIIAAFRPDPTHFQPSVVHHEPASASSSTQAKPVDTYSEQGLSSISIAESSLSSASALADAKTSNTHNLATIDGYVNLDASLLSTAAPGGCGPDSTPFAAVQQVSIEFHATCCRSYFQFGARDAVNPTSGHRFSSDDEAYVDFGACRVGELQTRECEIFNRSAVELFWRIENAAPPFQVEDVESGRWVGLDGFANVAPFASRRLRIHFRPTEPHEIDAELTLENVADPDNTVVVHFHGTVSSAPLDNSLRLVSGTSLEFGDCCAGTWAQQTFAFTNVSDAPLEVTFSADKGYEVTFRLETNAPGEDASKPLQLDHSAIGANAVEPAPEPATPEPLPSEASAGLSRTIIHELARSTTSSTNASRSLPSLPSGGGRPLLPFNALIPRSPRSDQSEHTFGSSGPPSDIFADSPVASSDGSTPRTYHPALNREFHSPLGPNSIISTDLASRSQAPAAGGLDRTVVSSDGTDNPPRPKTVRADLAERGLFRVQDRLKVLEQRQSASVDQMHAKPGVMHRIIVSYRPTRATSFDEDGGRLHKKNFRVHVSWRPWGVRGAAASVPKERVSINCKARVCSSFIAIRPATIDFGEVELGSSVQGTLSITNLSEISARVDLRFISKVLSAYRDEIEIEVGKTVDLKLDMVPRRTNPSYQKQVSVHNLLNPENSQVCLVKAVNVDTRGVAFHSLFYRLLTPTGGNFLEFGNVPINSTGLRAFTIQNTSSAALALRLAASHPEDYQLFVRKGESSLSQASTSTSTPPSPTANDGSKTDSTTPSARDKPKEPPSELGGLAACGNGAATAPRAPSSTSSSGTSKKAEIDSLILQLKEGDKGKATQSYGQSVGFKDRTLLADAEYLDLASGPPSVRRGSPRAKKTAYPDSKNRSQSRSRLAKLVFPPRSTAPNMSPAPSLAGDSSVVADEFKSPKLTSSEVVAPTTPAKKKLLRRQEMTSTSGAAVSPALTGRRRTRNVLPLPTDPSQLSLDEVLTALEHHSGHPDSAELSSWELEDAYVRKYNALKKALKTAIASGELIEVSDLEVAPGKEKTIYILVHPTGSRSNVQGSSRKQDGKIAIHLVKFASSAVAEPGAAACLPSTEIPVREVVLRWTTCRSTMDLGMAHINFGQLEKSSSKTRKISISNNSEQPLLYAVRKSGSIASGDLRVTEGRHGVIAGYGKREVSIVFEPHFAGAFEETIHVDNVEDEMEGQTIRVKAFILRPQTFAVSTTSLHFGDCAVHSISPPLKMSVTNVSKSQRTFSVSLDSNDFYFTRTALDVVLDPSATTSKVRGPLSAEEEEEVEGVLQKLKISRRKGQPDKEQKYVARLNLLGVSIPPNEAPAPAPTSSATTSIGPSASTTPVDERGERESMVLGAATQGGTLVVVEGGTGAELTTVSTVGAVASDPLAVVAAAATSSFGKNKAALSNSSSALSSSVTFTLEPSSQRDLAIVIIPRPVFPALDDRQMFEDVSAPITVSENADSKVVVTLSARILLGTPSNSFITTEQVQDDPITVGA